MSDLSSSSYFPNSSTTRRNGHGAVFATKGMYFPKFKKRINILLQHRDGPCLLIAIFNTLILKGVVSIESGVYSASTIIDMIQNINLHVHGLKKVLNGYFVNPSFSSCCDFIDYPKFLSKLNIQLVHAMVPEKNHKHLELIKNYSYDTLQVRLITLINHDSMIKQSMSNGGAHKKSMNSTDDFYKNNLADEIKVLKTWNTRLNRQVTNFGISEIEKQIQEGDAQIFFRNAHFACIYKHCGHVYSLITCKGLAAAHCAWHSLPNASGDFTYFDENFTQTVCNPWETALENIKTTKEDGSPERMKNDKKKKNKEGSKKNKKGKKNGDKKEKKKKTENSSSKKNDCLIA
ncbi:hypothetical protein TRFO_11549 [Tritrichomonas foetus]|uniref:MINDY deubiquitinase domain-containing protein n=1 Tax=Tritrichomonas foetus TaxID=1144522 RepID=A0A1J4J334_9EUKA|nr:hypothetical protein TRFO_11549 [Tritrichomonas foetus]|eukprot:OHS93762.1 hypothetical protein TRFO_11549 [Tritrichomonas foetus]